MTYSIYVDMDDVVADWKGHARKIIGPKWDDFDRVPIAEWQKLKLDPHFYRHLPLKEGANDLMDYMLEFTAQFPNVNLAFLTAIPRDNDMPFAIQDKVWWANEKFPGIPVFFGPYSKDKRDYVDHHLDVLIDDRLSNIEDWLKAGGRAHQYKNWQECKQWLDKTLI